ncbi:MAG: hypothetical protein JWR70_970 [Modestobacter sp.]|nr:hypothetical protein [Modestobacter sp.]
MVEGSDGRTDLLARIAAKRASVQAHLREYRPKTRRRSNVTIVLTSLGAVFTAGPAVGGERFSGGVARSLGLSSDSVVWRVLCLATVLVSVGAAVLTNLGKSQDGVGQLSTAEAVDGELEGLSLLLEFGHLPVEDAVKLYQQYTAKIGFIDDVPVPAGASQGLVPAGPPQAGAGEQRTRGLPAVPPPAHPRSGVVPPRPRPGGSRYPDSMPPPPPR